MSQKVLQYVEIDIDYCSLTYGVAPCQASLTDTQADANLLLHFLGDNGTTVIADSSPAAHGVATLVGGAVVSNTAVGGLGKFGNSSLRTAVAGTDYITFPDHADYNFGSGNFTVDFWAIVDVAATSYGLFGKSNSTPNTGYGMYVNTNGSVSAFFLGSVLGFTTFTTGTGLVSADGTFHHFALVRNGTSVKIYIDGVAQATQAIGGAESITTNTNVLTIAKRGDTALGLAGYVDEFRVVKGTAKFTANFTPSTTEYGPQTSTIKCFNSIVTCQDRPDFTNVPVTLRFAVPTNYLPTDIDCIPSIKSIDFDPAVISLGENLGQRATLTVNFDDHRHSDTGDGFDKYLADRTYDPYSQGTFWGKFRARQPFVRGRNIRWIQGFLGDALEDMETRHYIIDSFSGPDNNGKFTVIAKDMLKLADGDRALAPAVSNGFLNASLTNVATSFTVAPSGVGSEYAASGYIAIAGSEICSFTRSGDVFTIARAQLGTAASAHSAQDRVQTVLTYTSATPDVIIADLLHTYADVDLSFIPTADWATEISTYLNRLYTATIPQPTAVNDLISELIEQAGLSMWWDDRNQEIGMLVLRGLTYNTYLFSEDTVIADSFEVEEQPDLRLSQVHTYFGQINSLTSLTDKANYRSVSRIIDEQAEEDYGSASIKEIFSRWIPALGRTVADRLGSILLARFKDPPRHIKIDTLRGSTPEILLARGYQTTSKFLQDETGAMEFVNMQVTRLKPSADVIQIEADEVIYTAATEDLVHRQIIIDTDTANVNLRTAHDLIFPVPDASVTVICTVNSGVRLSSAGNSLMSLDIGSWPAGVTIIVNIIGGIRGAGGRGGDSFSNNAEAGGTAIYTRVPIKIALPSGGTLWAGGGGGGGTAYGGQASGSNLPSAGGGGGGIVGGIGGTGAAQASPGTEFAGGAASGPFVFGGAGGGPGSAGAAGFSGVVGGVFYQGQPGGGAGNAIDGVSFVTKGSYNATTFVFTPGAFVGSELGSEVN